MFAVRVCLFFFYKSLNPSLKDHTHTNSQENSALMFNYPEEKFIIVIIFHEMNHKDEKVTLFNNALWAFIINQGFSLFGYSFGRKTALYSILNRSLIRRSVRQIHLLFLLFGLGEWLGWQLTLMHWPCFACRPLMSCHLRRRLHLMESGLTPSQGDFRRAVQKHANNSHEVHSHSN